MGNIVFVRGIWLDLEGGDLKPDEFPDLFPDTRMAIFNTYNHAPEAPRFRVVLPTKDIMTPEAYIQIWEQIELKLKDVGYSVGRSKRGCNLRRSGLDKSKKPPTSLFYLPRQAKNPEDSFFWDFKDGRTALDPTQWIENSLFVAESFKITKTAFQEKDREPDQALIEAARTEWRNATPKGKGNDAFFEFAGKLRKAGMSDWEIEATLLDEAQYAHSPSDRRWQIPSIMKSLGKWS